MKKTKLCVFNWVSDFTHIVLTIPVAVVAAIIAAFYVGVVLLGILAMIPFVCLLFFVGIARVSWEAFIKEFKKI